MQRGLDKKERDEVEDLRRARAPVHFEVIRQEGEAELDRPVASLWWSGIAAGLAISTSAFSEGFLHSRLPNAEWRLLVENFGYCIGFVLVIIAITYAIALGDFAHVVAGSAEIFLLLISGEISVAKAFGGLLLPILVGNVLGGTALFSLIAYAQVKEEM
jgi:formate/nitrite transporter FocA (FNT family)